MRLTGLLAMMKHNTRTMLERHHYQWRAPTNPLYPAALNNRNCGWIKFDANAYGAYVEPVDNLSNCWTAKACNFSTSILPCLANAIIMEATRWRLS